jgi:hypothetical protein
MLHKNRASGMAQGEGPEFKSQYRKKKKEGQEGKIGPVQVWVPVEGGEGKQRG